jgi:hypothetical protein
LIGCLDSLECLEISLSLNMLAELTRSAVTSKMPYAPFSRKDIFFYVVY